jgi:hypothetical protein
VIWGKPFLLSALATRDRDHSRYVEQQPPPGKGADPQEHFFPHSVDIDVQLCPHREKACLVDEDSHSSAGTLPGPGASLPSSSGPGLTSPPYTATPIDHDYVKCKKPHQQAAPDGIVPVLPTVPRAAHQLRGGCFERLHLSLCFGEGGAGSGVTRAMLRLLIYLMDSQCLCFQDMLRSPSAYVHVGGREGAGLAEAASF